LTKNIAIFGLIVPGFANGIWQAGLRAGCSGAKPVKYLVADAYAFFS
jgi:hypothetical protein